MKYFPLSIFLSLIVFLFIPKFSFASAPQITASPSGTINLDQAFTISATMSGLTKNATYRIRVAVSLPGETTYFGSTYDGTNWHYGSINDENFVSVTTDNTGSWSGDVQGKVDRDDPNFTTGSGTYDVKLGRYTLTGSTATWSDPVPITVYVPPMPTPTPTPTIKQNSSTSSSISNSSSTTVPTSVRLPTVGVSKMPTQKITSPTASTSAAVLGAEVASVSPQISRKPKVLIKGTSKQSFPLVIFIAGSILLIAGSIISGIIFYRKRKLINGESV